MSPVFGAVFLWTSTAILWWSGWREEAAEDIPERAVAIFLAGWPFAVSWNPHVSPNFSVNGAFIWTFAAVSALFWRHQSPRRWASVSTGVLLGSINLFLERLAAFPSGLNSYYPSWAAALLIGWLSAFLLRNASEQVITISTALFLGETVSGLTDSTSEPLWWGGSPDWLEGWWIAVIFARVWSVAAVMVTLQARKWGWKMGLKRGGQRS